jgi:uncharacterized repeat protein (TIGR01451 family)
MNVPSKSTVTISFALSFPTELSVDEGSEVTNDVNVTDNYGNSYDDDATIAAQEPTFTIKREGDDDNNDSDIDEGFVETSLNPVSNNETVSYRTSVSNNSSIDAKDVFITNDIPGSLVGNEEICVGIDITNCLPTDDYKGNISNGITIDIPSKETVFITYDVTLGNNISGVVNSKSSYSYKNATKVEDAHDFNVVNPVMNITKDVDKK